MHREGQQMGIEARRREEACAGGHALAHLSQLMQIKLSCDSFTFPQIAFELQSNLLRLMSAFFTSPPDPSPLARLLHTYPSPRRAARLFGYTVSDFPPGAGRWEGLPLPPARRLSRRIRAKEGALRCESNTHPCHPCDPRTGPLLNPNILEIGPEF